MKYLIIVFCLFSISSNNFAKDVPSLKSPVVDQAGLLSLRVERALTKALYDIKKQTGNEIVVLTINSLEGEVIEDFSMKVAESWALGQKEKDNGILFLIAVDERKMRIEVGQGLEGELPDIKAGRIIRSVQPYFKNGDYKSGIIYGVSQIATNVGATLKNAPRVRNRRSGKGGAGSLLFSFFILSFFLRGRRGVGGGGIFSAMLLGSMLGGSSRRGSSFGGGGFSGGGFGGGGGFSGGGASGGW